MPKPKKKPAPPISMTPAQQQTAIAFLRAQLEMDDTAPNETGYNDHEDTMKLRVFLIEIGAVQDRRGKND